MVRAVTPFFTPGARKGPGLAKLPPYPKGPSMILTHRQLQGVTIINPEGKITLGDGDQELGEAVRCV